MTHWHRAHGLTIQSDQELPELLSGTPGTMDIRIAWTASEPVGTEPRIQRAGDRLSLTIPCIGTFSATAGRDLRVTPSPGADPALVRLYVLGSGMGMLLHQRGELVLHGAGVLAPDGVRIFLGPSGAGKSTLATRLSRSGWSVLSDDTVVVRPGGDTGFMAWPGARLFKLWRDTLDHLGAIDQAGPEISGRHTKHFVTNPAVAPDRGHNVAAIYVIEDGEDLGLHHLRGLQTIEHLTSNTYRPDYVRRLDRHPTHFRQMAALVDAVPIWRLTRPRDLGQLDLLCTMITDHEVRA